MFFNLKNEPLFNLSFYDNVRVLVKSTELCYPLCCKQTLKFIFQDVTNTVKTELQVKLQKLSEKKFKKVSFLPRRYFL